MRFNQSTIIPGESEPSVRLKCADLRVAFWAFNFIFIIFLLVIFFQVAQHTNLPRIANTARAVNNYFGTHVGAFMAGPAVVMLTLLYFVYGRKTLTWYNGVLIDDKPIDVLYYQFKHLGDRLQLIYLQSARRRWIIYPVTSQDGYRFPNIDIIKKETAKNDVQLKILQQKLMESSAKTKNFLFFTGDAIFFFSCFMILVVLVICNSL